MPSTVYTRRDHVIRIALNDKVAEILSTPPDGQTLLTAVASEILDHAAHGDDAELRVSLAPVLSVPTTVAWPSTIDRIILEVGERRWSAIPFESFLLPG